MNGESAPAAPVVAPQRKFRRLAWGVGIACFLLLTFCIAPPLILIPGATLFYCATSWVWFLQRVANQIEVYPAGIGLTMVAFIILVWGIQFAVQKVFPFSTWRVAGTIRCTVGVIAILTGGICLVGLGHELSWWARSKERWMWVTRGFEAVERTQSRNNLKQIGLAVHGYENKNGRFPAGGTFRPDGAAGHGWIAQLLPYIDQAPLYDRIQQDLPWYDPANHEVFLTHISSFENPLINEFDPSPSDAYAPTHYAANDRLLSVNEGMTIGSISDGTSNTILAGEVKDNIRPWGDAVNWRNADLGINQSRDGFGSPFKGGIHFLLGDGTVRFLNEKIDPKTLKALATPNGGETIGEF